MCVALAATRCVFAHLRSRARCAMFIPSACKHIAGDRHRAHGMRMVQQTGVLMAIHDTPWLCPLTRLPFRPVCPRSCAATGARRPRYEALRRGRPIPCLPCMRRKSSARAGGQGIERTLGASSARQVRGAILKGCAALCIVHTAANASTQKSSRRCILRYKRALVWRPLAKCLREVSFQRATARQSVAQGS